MLSIQLVLGCSHILAPFVFLNVCIKYLSSAIRIPFLISFLFALHVPHGGANIKADSPTTSQFGEKCWC